MVLMCSLSLYPLIKQAQGDVKDGLGIAPSPEDLLGLSPNQVPLCSDLLLAWAFASSSLKGNWQPSLSCAEGCTASEHTPQALSSAVPVETWVVPPTASSHAPLFRTPSYPMARWPTPGQTK